MAPLGTSALAFMVLLHGQSACAHQLKKIHRSNMQGWMENSSKQAALNTLPQPTRGLCRKHELVTQDLQFGSNATYHVTSKAPWIELFKNWAGKKILLAGDSLMDQFFEVVACTVELMGGLTSLSNVVKFEWNGKDTIVNDTSGLPWGSVSSSSASNINSQGVVYRLKFKKLPVEGESDISVMWVDYFRYYAMTDTCQKCGAGCGNVCAEDDALVTKVDTLVRFIGKYDEAYINMGHDMGSVDSSILSTKAELFQSVLKHLHLDDRITLMEHPAQHFPGSDTGDWLHSLNHTRCACDLARMDDQIVAKNNRMLVNISTRNKIPIARIWGPFAKYGCDKQRPPDCTHYHISPNFWAAAVRIINSVRRPSS